MSTDYSLMIYKSNLIYIYTKGTHWLTLYPQLPIWLRREMGEILYYKYSFEGLMISVWYRIVFESILYYFINMPIQRSPKYRIPWKWKNSKIWKLGMLHFHVIFWKLWSTKQIFVLFFRHFINSWPKIYQIN